MPKKSKKTFDDFSKSFILLLSGLGTLVLMCMIFNYSILSKQQPKIRKQTHKAVRISEPETPVDKYQTFSNEYFSFEYPVGYIVWEDSSNYPDAVMYPVVVQEDPVGGMTAEMFRISILDEEELVSVVSTMFSLKVGESVEGWARLPDGKIDNLDAKVFVNQGSYLVFVTIDNVVYKLTYVQRSPFWEIVTSLKFK